MMKLFSRFDASSRKKQNGNRAEEIGQRKAESQIYLEELRHKFSSSSVTSNDGSRNIDDDYFGEFNNLEEQVMLLKNKLKCQSLLSKPMQECDRDGASQLQNEIFKLKARKVELQRKIKQDAVQLRTFQALHEKEVLQLKKDERKIEYERQKLLVFNERLKMVVQRKTEEASMTTKLLKDLLKCRKAFPRSTDDPRLQDINHQIEVTQRLNEVYTQSELQLEKAVRMAEESVREKEEADILIQQKLWFLLEDKEAECKEKDSELRNLNEKVVRLSNLVKELSNITDQIDNTTELKLLSDGIPENTVCTESRNTGFEMRSTEDSSNVDVSGIVKTDLKTCCACGTKSLCKTNKCACRIKGGICGISCACSSTRCTNREPVIVNVASNPLSDVGNIEVANAVNPKIVKRIGRKR